MTKTTLRIETPSDLELRILRDFNAPRRLVFEAWTKPDLVKRWLAGPAGWTMTLCRIDLKVGGEYRYQWRHEDGREMGLGGVYLEVEAPVKTVATEAFDEAWYAGEAVVSTVLTEAAGRTTCTMTVRYASKEARDMAAKSGMEKGMEASYERLDDLLASRV